MGSGFRLDLAADTGPRRVCQAWDHISLRYTEIFLAFQGTKQTGQGEPLKGYNVVYMATSSPIMRL